MVVHYQRCWLCGKWQMTDIISTDTAASFFNIIWCLSQNTGIQYWQVQLKNMYIVRYAWLWKKKKSGSLKWTERQIIFIFCLNAGLRYLLWNWRTYWRQGQPDLSEEICRKKSGNSIGQTSRCSGVIHTLYARSEKTTGTRLKNISETRGTAKTEIQAETPSVSFHKVRIHHHPCGDTQRLLWMVSSSPEDRTIISPTADTVRKRFRMISGISSCRSLLPVIFFPRSAASRM